MIGVSVHSRGKILHANRALDFGAEGSLVTEAALRPLPFMLACSALVDGVLRSKSLGADVLLVVGDTGVVGLNSSKETFRIGSFKTGLSGSTHWFSF